MAEGKGKGSRNGAYVFLQLLFPSLRSFLRRAQRLAAMPHSHHSHSGQFCAHARGTLEEVVQAAVRRGFTTYGLSEHAPRALLDHLYPEELEAGLTPPDLAARFNAYVVEAHRLKDAFDGEIQLLVGLETENISHQDLVYLESVLVKYGARIEYVVGSVHHVKGIPIDLDRPTYDRALAIFGTGSAAMSSFLSAYFDAQYELLVAVQPEIIGHVDLCRLYEPALKLEEHPEAWGKLERNIRYAIEYGALFEFNAAALRKNWPGAYPGGDVVQLIRVHGGRFALSDDSHGPDAVGLNYDKMREYILKQGVVDMYYLRRTAIPNHRGRLVETVKVESDWASHPFWE